jgi:septum formation protein
MYRKMSEGCDYTLRQITTPVNHNASGNATTTPTALRSIENRSVVLASGSPRRKELLGSLLDDFDIMPSDIPEIAHGAPRQQVMQLARDKAEDVAKRRPHAIVIGADTLVAIGRHVLGKPHSEADAAAMLRRLSGRTHRVYTGVAVVSDGRTHVQCGITRVRFATLSDDEIADYIATGDPMDKAGAYGIQGIGGKFIRGIQGCYFNVMGLPLNIVYRMLKALNTG